ncbi:MAG TPA: GntR family transcriptional regulator [Solirubrobacteraceae bacterium]|jgi:GntR family transcriptional regulator|nr:GntR family transcriptional regulator [Solirubrobacteraceae bacterium]
MTPTETAPRPRREHFFRPGAGARRGGGGSVEDAARRLRDVLRSEVLTGAFPDGLLPGETELMLKHDARRATVRGALIMLRDEGVVERVQGIGTFAVRERYVTRMAELHGESSSDGISPQIRSRVLDRTVAPAPDFVARKLALTPGELVLRLEYIALLEGEPLGLATNYVAYPQAEAIAVTPFKGDWYTLLHDAGVSFGGTEWVLSAINADSVVAHHLRVEPGTALMLGEEMIQDEHEAPFDFAVCYVRTDRYAFSSSSWSIGSRDDGGRLVSSPDRPVGSLRS